jgi:hypothetical protein
MATTEVCIQLSFTTYKFLHVFLSLQHYIWAAGHFVVLISFLRYMSQWIMFQSTGSWWYKGIYFILGLLLESRVFLTIEFLIVHCSVLYRSIDELCYCLSVSCTFQRCIQIISDGYFTENLSV